MKERKETTTRTAATSQENKLPPVKVTSSSSEELTVSSLLTSSRLVLNSILQILTDWISVMVIFHWMSGQIIGKAEHPALWKLNHA